MIESVQAIKMQVKRDLPLMMQKVDAEEEEKKNKEK